MPLTIAEIEHKIKPVLRTYGVRSASVVGSVAREENSEESDIDIIVEITTPVSLLTFAKLKHELEEALHTNVDLIERTAIKPRLRKNMLKDEVSLSICVRNAIYWFTLKTCASHQYKNPNSHSGIFSCQAYSI